MSILLKVYLTCMQNDVSLVRLGGFQTQKSTNLTLIIHANDQSATHCTDF